MDFWSLLLVLFTGLIAGVINTLAGGGSLISLPVLIFMGLPPATANGTNRIAIFSQNIFGIAGFKSKGVSAFPYSLWLGLSAFLGALIGAKIAVDIPGDLFNRILAILMIIVVGLTVFDPLKNINTDSERITLKARILGVLVFFFIGIYGGFIQAGIGFLIIAALRWINRFNLVKTNSAKVVVVLVYTIAALGVFIMEDKINWIYGLALAVGNSTGAWFASRWSVDKGDRVIRFIIAVAVSIFAIKLWVF